MNTSKIHSFFQHAYCKLINYISRIYIAKPVAQNLFHDTSFTCKHLFSSCMHYFYETKLVSGPAIFFSNNTFYYELLKKALMSMMPWLLWHRRFHNRKLILDLAVTGRAIIVKANNTNLCVLINMSPRVMYLPNVTEKHLFYIYN